MLRKLASVQRVTEVEPIPGADSIERLRVLGWWVVAKKGEYRIGDQIVYCEIDSLLPEVPDFEFLRTSSYRSAIEEGGQVIQRAGFRIRTVKLRGQVSQGICFPTSIIPPGIPVKDGVDLTSALGIIKYESPLPLGLSGRVKGPFPAFLPKTDELRIQVLEPLLERYRGVQFTLTEKLDGTSFTAFRHDGEFGLCSRNQWLDETDQTNTLCRLAGQLKLPEILERIESEYGFVPAIQGEVIGPGIQGNKYGMREHQLFVFNLLDVGQYRLIDRPVQSRILAEAGLTPVPEVGTLVLNHGVDELVSLSIGTSVLKTQVQREGLVFRPESERSDPDIGGRLSFKVINPNFLIKYDE